MKSYDVSRIMFISKNCLRKVDPTQEKSCKNKQAASKLEIPAIQAPSWSTKLHNAMGMEIVFLLGNQNRFQESRQVPLTLICIPHPPQNTSPTI